MKTLKLSGNMITIPISRNKWRLKSGLLYAGYNDHGGAMLVSADDAAIFDDNDNPEIKAKFYGVILGRKFEVEACE